MVAKPITGQPEWDIPLNAALDQLEADATAKAEAARIAAQANLAAQIAASRDRATHTGTQGASTIADLPVAIRTELPNALRAGENITLTPDATTGALIVESTAQGSSGDAYDVAVAEGFVGTREEWLAQLVGPAGPPGEGTRVLIDGVFTAEVNLSSAPLAVSDVTGLQAELDAIHDRISNLPGAVVSAPTWSDIKALAQTGDPVVVLHRGAGGNIAQDNAISALDRALSIGMKQRMVFDGGDARVTFDSKLFNHHNSTTGERLSADLTISATALVDLQALFFKNWPEYLTGNSTEKPPSQQEWLQKIKDSKRFCVPETKVTEGAVPLRDMIVALGMTATTQVQAFAGTAAEADARLGPARDAGISVGLLQSANSNIGFPAITTCVRGGKPDVLLYQWDTLPGSDDAYIQAAINAGIGLQVGTVERRSVVEVQRQRVEAMGGRLTFVVSDDPFYISKSVPPRSTDRFASQQWEHGLLTSKQSTAVPEIGEGRLKFLSSNTQYALLGFFAAESAWPRLEVDIRFDVLDTSTGRWAGIFHSLADDSNYHDGSEMTASLACLLRQTGELAIFDRSSPTSSTLRATNDPTKTSTGTASNTTLSPITVAGTVVRVRIENLRDDSGAFTGQCRFTRLDTGQWVMTALGAGPVRGPYMHVGKNGSTGSRIHFSNFAITR